MQLPTVSIVTPVHNKLPYVRESVQSMLTAADAYPVSEVVVVDNGSSDGSIQLVRDLKHPKLRVLSLAGGTIAAARNAGACASHGEVLLFVDCDCVVPADHLHNVAEAFRSTSAVGVGCTVGLPGEPTWLESTWHALHDFSEDGLRPWINSGNFAVLRRSFEDVGGFDETLVTGEDTDLCRRLVVAGGTLEERRALVVAHLDNAKTSLAFIKKEQWRSLGVMATAGNGAVSLPLLATLAHFAMLLISVAALIAFWPRILPAVATSLGLVLAIPIASVVYRWRRGPGKFNVILGVYLYQLYLLARIAGIVSIAFGGGRVRKRGTGRTSEVK